jgi:hypothetical protein
MKDLKMLYDLKVASELQNILIQQQNEQEQQ